MTLEQLTNSLRMFGCVGCKLGQYSDIHPVVYRGNPEANKMIIGEAPGKNENQVGKPFTGPAGCLLHQIFKCVGWDTNKDWYLGNVVKCRPVSFKAGKQNLTPGAEHRKACLPYIQREIDLIQPKVVVLLGKTATLSLFPEVKDTPMYKLVGHIYDNSRWLNTKFFIMYHPSAILHAKSDADRYYYLRYETWQHVKYLKTIVESLEGEKVVNQ